MGIPRGKGTGDLSAEVEKLRSDVDELLKQMDAVLKKPEPEQQPPAPVASLDTKRRIRLPDDDVRQVPPGGHQGNRGSGNEDDFDRVAKMLEDIRKLLESLVNSKFPLPADIRESIVKSWPVAEAGLQKAQQELRLQRPAPKYRRLLTNAGFTGEMLDLKENSLRLQKKQIEKAILTYTQNESLTEKVARWLKPGFKAMNSILGSLSGLPGVEIAREFKDHLESGIELIEVGQAE
jgi:hypothetical protein